MTVFIIKIAIQNVGNRFFNAFPRFLFLADRSWSRYDLLLLVVYPNQFVEYCSWHELPKQFANSFPGFLLISSCVHSLCVNILCPSFVKSWQIGVAWQLMLTGCFLFFTPFSFSLEISSLRSPLISLLSATMAKFSCLMWPLTDNVDSYLYDFVYL